jgi:hypothetical protein
MTTKQELVKFQSGFDKTIASLSKRLGAFGKAIQEDLLLLNKVAAFKFFENVIKRTPVDTGRLRANFQIDTKTNSIKIDATAKPANPSLPASKIYWVFNNIDYLIQIEQGSSRQAPQGMIKLALQQVDAEIIKEMKLRGLI